MTRIDGAIFDLDGTLTDSMYIWDQAPVQLVRQFGGNPPPDLARELKAMGRRQASEYMVERFRLSCTPEELMRGINDLVNQEYCLRAPMKPGADRLLYRLNLLRVPCCVATASEAFQAEAALERLGLWRYMAFALSCLQYGEKSGPEIYLKAAEEMGVKPGRTVVFEDALHAARTAKEAGFLVAAVHDPSAEEDRGELERLADWYLEDLNQWQL